MRAKSILFAAAFLAACASTAPTSAPTRPTGPSTVPRGELSLGPYQNGNVDGVARAFQESVAGRYGRGMPLASVVGDLTHNRFGCTAQPASRGDPPDRTCTRIVRDRGCSHTFRVLLYSDSGSGGLDRTRALYDRTCAAGNGLLGGF